MLLERLSDDSSAPLFYGWYIVGITIASMMLVYGVRNSFSVLFSPILDDFGWYRGSTAIMLSLNILIYGLSAPLAGGLVDRWKPRAVAVLGILTLILATALCYFANQLWHFYLLFGVLAPIGTAFCGAPILSPSLMNWFGKRRGLAIGALVALISVKDTSQPWLLYIYAICSGFATGLFSPNIFAGMGDIFHGKNIGAISSLLLTGTGIGGAIGPWLGGYIYDITKSYTVAFIISMTAFVVAGISFWIAAPRNADRLRAKMQRMALSGWLLPDRNPGELEFPLSMSQG